MPDLKKHNTGMFLKYISSQAATVMRVADVRYMALNGVLIFVSSGILVYLMFLNRLTINIGHINIVQINVAYMTLSTICITGIAVLRIRLPFFMPTVIPIILFAINAVGLLRMGYNAGFSALWIFIIPPLTYFTAERKIGLAVSITVFAGSLLFLFLPRSYVYYYSGDKRLCIIIIYILLALMSHLCEFINISKEKNLKKLNNLLKLERDEISAMRNSLKTSLFLMDKDLIIQKNYSRQLEDTLGMKNLSGRKFTDLLTLSLTLTEISTIQDYLDMVCKRRFEPDMLDNINPLQELKYINVENGQKREKILHCTFTPIDRPSNETVIMGNIEDITAKFEFQKQLKQKEVKHQQEMNNLFEVLQIEPSLFSDFIEDTEYEFETINNILKNARISSKDALSVVFQSIHAIKANAVILGLNSYGEKLHDIEKQIKEIQGKAEIVFDDMLTLTFSIEEAMKTKDRFTEDIEKIKSFIVEKTKRNAVDILIENLKRTAQRVAMDTGKKVETDTGGVDAEAFKNAPRRLVKEVMLQLVRNAVFHGIESPEERIRNGKPETGRIVFSLEYEEGNRNIYIKLQDDGCGLEYDKIKRRAEKMHLIRENEDIKDKALIYQAIFMPGFSTVENKSIHAGQGVGLDLVRARIEEYNGRIKIQTEAGKGSTFHIFLPVENMPQKDKDNE